MEKRKPQTLLYFQCSSQQAPDAGDAGAGRQVPGLRGRLRGLGARRQAPGLGQVHELRPDLRGARLRYLQQGKRTLRVFFYYFEDIT